ncbi:hypothetical protein GCM10023322_50990 [Rugosimonospora acidiphila]|uniref:2-oxoacid dehydrogenase acyltransferase catalytic domain-containing protein n=1 Tax=Rugosimonospora acidiphila TaxID=556531 RepID=A0ABP9S8Z1_9ACTN
MASAAGPATAAEEPVPLSRVRRATAAAMVASASTIPQVTEFMDVDATRTMRLLRRLRADPAYAGLRVSPLLITAYALAQALRHYPDMNIRWDDSGPRLLRRRTVDLGIAVATERGLLVPHVRAAEGLTLRELAGRIGTAVAATRDGSCTPADLAPGSITLTNLGTLGVDSGTPLILPGETAILALGTVRTMPWMYRGEVVPRDVVHLALTFDHRVVDGDLGARVLTEVAESLRRPLRLLTHA